MTTDKALAALAKLSLVSATSYLAPLLVVGNQSWTTHSMAYPSIDCRTTLVLPAYLLDDPSVQTFHGAAP